MTKTSSLSKQPRPLAIAVRERRHHIPVGSRRVEVVTFGDDDAAPVLFLHGFGACPDIYRDALTALARRGHKVIAPALPSFGRSTPLPWVKQGVNGVADHMAALLDEVHDLTHGGPIHVIGHSFGGGVALRLAAAHPHLVKSLTLISPVGGADLGAIAVHEIISGVISGDAGKGWLRNGFHHFVPAVLRHAPGVLATGLSAWFSAQLDDVVAVKAHRLPVRFLFADRDHLVRPGSIPRQVCETVTVEFLHGRHSWLIGEPERFADAVLHARSTTETSAA